MPKKLITRLLTGGILVSTIVLLSPILFWSYVLASISWTHHIEAKNTEPWDGCAAPRTSAELVAWIASSEATGEPMCNPDVVNMIFPEEAEDSQDTAPLAQ